MLLDLLNEKEEQRENIKDAYVRYIKGQFKVNIDEMVEINGKIDMQSLHEDLILALIKYNTNKANDDFEINYGEES